MEKAIQDKIDQWLSSSIDQETKNAIQALVEKNDEHELSESFYRDLEFGTGGLRGIMGIGSNRINKYTVGMATQGLANYLKDSYPNQQIKVAVAYDSRNNSQSLGNIVADVFSANGIMVYLFSSLRPTPELSFAIRHLGCQSGVVLTASHNPKEYNGYKAYWSDGGQLVPPHDKNVIAEVQKVRINDVSFERNASLVVTADELVDEEYQEMLAGLVVNKAVITKMHDLKIVFSPIHGTGITHVPPILEKIGFTNVTVVEEQAVPDGNFPTVVYPNPEEAEAMKLALSKAEEIDADLVMATDPDADRVGIAVKNKHGEFQLLNGNQTGSLLIYYLLNAWKKASRLDGRQYIVKTIVTSDIIHLIARDFKVDSYDTLTGFKYIAEVIREKEGKAEFIAGGEESYGYLVGDKVRDKDAVASCALIAEMTAAAKSEGSSLFDYLIEMYKKYGFFKEKLVSITKKGRSGSEEIAEMMKNFRENPPKTLAGMRIVTILDYQNGRQQNLHDGSETTLDFPKSNVLQFITEDGTKISARPSGTEPKIKFYFSVNEPLTSEDEFDKISAVLDDRINTIIRDLGI